MNSLGQSLEDRLVRWNLTPGELPDPNAETDSDRPTQRVGPTTTQQVIGGRVVEVDSSAVAAHGGRRLTTLGGLPVPGSSTASDKESIARAQLAETQAEQIQKEIEQASQHLRIKMDQLAATITDLKVGQYLDQKRYEHEVVVAKQQYDLAKKAYDLKLREFEENATLRGLTGAQISAQTEKILLDNKILEHEFKTLETRTAALTATLLATETQNQETIGLRARIAAMEQRKGKKGTLETIELPVSDDDVISGVAPSTTQQRVTWTEFDEQELAAAYAALQALTGKPIERPGSRSNFGQTAAEIAAEHERDRALDRELRRAEITAEIMMSQSSQQLQVAVANGQMTTEAALTVYQQRNANARTYVMMEMDRAELQYSDLASTRVYAANLLSSEMDLTKFLLERRVPEEREWLREPGTPVGGVAGQPLDPVRVDPHEVAVRMTEEMGIDRKTEEAKAAAMRAVVEAERRLGSAQEAAPTVSTIDTPDPVSPAETAASLIPTGAP